MTAVLTKVTRTSITQIAFPEDARTASVIPLDKGKPNKKEVSNLSQILVSFFKIYERVIKGQIGCGMEKYFPPFLSAYRKNYSLQNI